MGRPVRFIMTAFIAALISAACSGSSPAPEASGGRVETEAPNVDATSSRPKDGSTGKWRGPNFTVETFDGTTFELAAQAGRPVVINFWESW